MKLSMRLTAFINEGLANLFFSKLRSLLALTGILVGTASVVAMVMGGELATNEALKQFRSLGTNLLAINLNNIYDEMHISSGKNDQLTFEQAINLKESDDNISKLSPYSQTFAPITYQGKAMNGMILGVVDNFASIVHVDLLKGRFVSILDEYRHFCVIGYKMYEEIKQLSIEDPIGKQIQIAKHFFTIVGVAKRWPENNFIYANIDHAVLVPLLASTEISQYATISNIIIQLKEGADIEGVKNHLNQAFLNLNILKQMNFRSAKELIEKMKKQSNILTLFLGLIGSISLIVGGIGVMNIMLVSVIERKKEIGIRLALGATRLDICTLFLVEAVMLSLVGGSLGVILGIVVAFSIAWLWGWTFSFFIWPAIAGFSVSVLVGIFFGFYPAYQASCLNPIDALRSE